MQKNNLHCPSNISFSDVNAFENQFYSGIKIFIQDSSKITSWFDLRQASVPTLRPIFSDCRHLMRKNYKERVWPKASFPLTTKDTSWSDANVWPYKKFPWSILKFREAKSQENNASAWEYAPLTTIGRTSE